MSNTTNEAKLYQTVLNCYNKSRESLISTAQLKKSIKILVKGSEEYHIANEILKMELEKTKHYLHQYVKMNKEYMAVSQANQFAHNTTELDKILTKTYNTNKSKDSQS